MIRKINFALSLVMIISLQSFGQFTIESYQEFLAQTKNFTSMELLENNSAGLFLGSINQDINNILFLDSIEIKYGLTEYEKSLLKNNGFVVSERLQKGSFGGQFEDIYHKDLPVYISSDAILHAFHSSYDKILKDTELNLLIPKLKLLLDNFNSNFPMLAAKYNTQPNLLQMLKDVDIYLSVAYKLLNSNTFSPNYYKENGNYINALIKDINSNTWITRQLFSESYRKIDFSQFKPRGHYDDEHYPELKQYFRTMMWFGRIELYLIAPKEFQQIPSADVQRQIIMSKLISELIEISNQRELFDEIEYIIKIFVGEQDNVTLPDLEDVFSAVKIKTADILLDTLKVKEFQDTLKTKSFAQQKILSQILMSDPMSTDKIEPASAFMPFGQRFVIDSYVTGNVVFDRINATRMLPSTLDILFALGNDASGQLLKDELDTYKYSPNLAALRYLIDSYDFDFWNGSIYNLWLNSIRSLNPPLERNQLPAFMQTAAWWQHKMNTQLSSWTELRHDNLLYAKQSYSGGIICSYPYSYVEPVPEFYKSMSILARNTFDKLNSIYSFNSGLKENLEKFFNHFAGVNDTLETIANKELNNLPINYEEENFLKRMLYNNPFLACGTPQHVGWYPELYYYDFDQANFHKADYLVADYHTAPTDASGNTVGWVKHAGTGPVNLAIIIAKNPDNNDVAFIGPVSSYYEYTSTNFYRLTDSEWKDNYLFQHGSKPNWVNNYLSDLNGESLGEGISLLTDIKEGQSDSQIPNKYILAQNYPNPFNPSTIIQFTIPLNLNNLRTKLTIYNIQGEIVDILVDEILPSGTYLSRWNGNNNLGNKVSSGVYFYEVKTGTEKFVGKMNLLK